MRFGVDEAGKGPVLGSMFAAAVLADPDALPGDVGDSKGVPRERREAMAAEIREAADCVAVAEIIVEEIDAEETDMNTLTVEAHARALSKLLAGRDGSESYSGFVDAGDTNAVRFGQRLRERLDADVELRAEHEADATYRIVGAASVIAKVARDAHVRALSAKYGDVGSGYPSDPTTRAFLQAHVETYDELPECARASWQTSKDALAAAAQASLDAFE
ncbi:ribonuclease HII [Halapricum hydrolyticum]|uniref:Ribonuclease HII n=1 Tax=Halapricum hydrolyticum TaxID=2979991 RepID=A0AAE3LJH3_9EURY|nr:ribonuclease HII [Halapricum hydrolyticum]MCU4719133.1 ribonuclease HII [Halapricum hydrolyticum]MCU4727323.1 ribonuclease HII [Halapricum hydrolyticum]